MYHFLQKLIRLLRPMKETQCKGSPLQFFLPFLRNLQSRKRPKGPPFNFFSALRLFFRNFFKVKRVPPSSFFDILQQCMLMNPKGSPLFIFRHYATFSKFFQKKISKNFSNFILFPVGKQWFSSHIEHERHTLGVSKVFSKLFMNTSWAYLENFALLEP